MRGRLLGTSLPLLTVVLVALTVPLAVVIAAQSTQAVFIDRSSDTGRFAALAGPALRTGETVTLQAELRQYDSLFGIAAAVVDRDGTVVVASREPALFGGPGVRRRLVAALAGERAGTQEVVWPWQDRALVIAEPVSDGGEVVGAAVTVSPTGPLRRQTAQRWGVLALLGLVSLAGSWLLALPVLRWVLRPVHDLDEATHEIAAGRLGARVAAATGPPELRRLAGSFNAMADAVAAAMARQRSFVASASHQLRNPLTALRLRLENLGGTVPPADRDEHRVALEEADRLAGILDGLLALARAEQDGHGCEVVDAGEAVDARLAVWRPVAERRGVRLRRTGAAGTTVRALPGAIDQALDAILDNALKFGAGGDEVTVHLAPRDGEVELHVIDHGPGLTEQERLHATERFWRGGGHQNVDGSGLGLSIARALAEASGGRLDLLPAEPSGLDACLVLPAAGGQTASFASR
jgi:signal transduction histidine kinase